MDNFKEEQRFLKAKKEVKEIKAFYIHFFIYCLCSVVIVSVNLIFVPQFHWFWFSLGGWGLGIFFHWLAVFGFKKIGFNKNWEERKIKELMDNDIK